MTDTCSRCHERHDIGSLIWITAGWGGRRTALVCWSCKRNEETYDSACD